MMNLGQVFAAVITVIMEHLMETHFVTVLEVNKMDTSHRTFEQFLIAYQPVLKIAEDYLEEVIEKTYPAYAEAYKPWEDALHELLIGVNSIARKIPLPDKNSFIDILEMFSLDSTIKFLLDIYKLCHVKLRSGWDIEFRENINKLLGAMRLA